MNRFDFLNAMGELPDEVVADSVRSGKKYRKPIIAAFGTLAACLLVFVIVNFQLITGFIFGGDDFDASGGNGAPNPSLSFAVYYVENGEMKSLDVGDISAEETLSEWRKLNKINDNVDIYLISTLNGGRLDSLTDLDLAELRPDGAFVVNAVVSEKINSLDLQESRELILESLRLTLISYFEARITRGEVIVNVSLVNVSE